jgi:hypothetical protein
MELASNYEIWAQILLSKEDCERIKEFLVAEVGINQGFVIPNMHLTFYHSQVLIPEIKPTEKDIYIILPASETRFMVMVVGGENPLPGVDPGMNKIGIRIQRRSSVVDEIIEMRNELSRYETREILGDRSPSSRKKSAFGSRYFQPHISLLKPGSGISSDLTVIGQLFREKIGDLVFDKYKIDIV